MKLLNLSQGIQVLTFVIVSPLWAGLWPRRTWGFGRTRRDIECSCTAFPDWSPHCMDNCRKQTHCSLIYSAVLNCDWCHSVSIMTELVQCKLGRAVAKSLLKPWTNQKQVQMCRAHRLTAHREQMVHDTDTMDIRSSRPDNSVMMFMMEFLHEIKIRPFRAWVSEMCVLIISQKHLWFMLHIKFLKKLKHICSLWWFVTLLSLQLNTFLLQCSNETFIYFFNQHKINSIYENVYCLCVLKCTSNNII